MPKKRYICIVTSSQSGSRVYDVETSSAMKCVRLHGKAEDGECITVRTRSGKLVSRVLYMREIGYFRLAV